MALDPYDTCPCGSGKKLKFCCSAIAADMEQVRRLNESNQTQACLKKLEGLLEKHPRNPWALNYRASMQLSLGDAQAAQDDLRVVLEDSPDHQMGLVLYANALFASGGFEAARPVIHRCFQKCIRDMPGFVGDLAMNVASEMVYRRKYMAARQHMVFAIRFVPEKDRQQVFEQLHTFDSSIEIPYPLRSVHLLADEKIEGDDAAFAGKARRLAEIGCWGPAAKVFAKLAETHPDNAAVQQNLGLCRAWDGNQSGAAEALHAAARLDSDRPNAVECETVAQLLDRETAEDRISTVGWTFKLNSVARVLSRCDDDSRLVAIPLREQDKTEQRLSALYQVLDRSLDGLELTPESDLGDVPNVVGHLALYDRDKDADEPAYAFLTGFQEEAFDRSREFVNELLADELQGEPVSEPVDDEDSVSREEWAVFWRWHCPPKLPAVIRKTLEQRKWKHVTEEIWPNTPLLGLGGKTPKEAAGNPDLTVPLLAALYVFDSYCNSNRFVLDFDAMCASVGVTPPEPLQVDEKTPITHFSAMQLKRIDVKSLADEQLIYVSNRAIMLHHGAFLYETLEELLSRPGCVEKVGDLNEIYQALVELSVERYRPDLAFQWIERVREWSRTQENAFERELQWAMRELMLRFDDPSDEKIRVLFKEIHARYGKKIPQVNQYLAAIAESFEKPELLEGLAGLSPAGTEPAEGLWTPDEPAESGASGDKKLWLPGQE